MTRYTADDLRHTLARIDGRGYKAYKDIEGGYAFDQYTLFIDHVQGDPFAAPSKLRIRVPQQTAQLPTDLFANRIRQIALQDFLTRQVDIAIDRFAQGRRGSGTSGRVSIDVGGQEVIERTAVIITPQWVEARLEVGLPAAGRSVLGRQATAVLCDELPRIVARGLFWRNVPQQEGQQFVACVENQEHIRSQLPPRGLVAFIADGAILPRVTGISDRPLPTKEAVPFQSPPSLRITIDLPNALPDSGATQITGMGIPQGVTLLVGGGYHGKSTVLQALERGVYPHIPGDGREYVVTSPDAVKIRAEDGRRVEQVDISPFISTLPYGRSTTAFVSDDASGSTSQATNIVEALEVGAKVLLLDEDTSATNFMVRDARMQALVAKQHEPITPFLDRVHELYATWGVSSILVMGGSGDYFDVADTVIMLREYVPHDVTAEARQIASSYPTHRHSEAPAPLSRLTARIPLPDSFDASRGRREVKITAKGHDLLLYGSEAIELRGVEQVVDTSQTRAIGFAIYYASEQLMDGKTRLAAVLKALERWFGERGLDGLDPFRHQDEHPGNFARPRRYEIAAAINRLRTVRMRQG